MTRRKGFDEGQSRILGAKTGGVDAPLRGSRVACIRDIDEASGGAPIDRAGRYVPSET